MKIGFLSVFFSIFLLEIELPAQGNLDGHALENWDVRVPNLESLSSLDVEAFFHRDGMDFVSQIYQHIVDLYKSDRAVQRDLDLFFEFSLEVNRVVEWLAYGELNEDVRTAFDDALSEILIDGIKRDHFDIPTLTAQAQEKLISFVTPQRKFLEFITKIYLKTVLGHENSEHEKEDSLIAVRDLVATFCKLDDAAIPYLHRTYLSEYWNHVYSNARNLVSGALADGIDGLQGPHSLIVKSTPWFDWPAKFYLFDRLVATSNNPKEILKALANLRSKIGSDSFPRYDGSGIDPYR